MFPVCSSPEGFWVLSCVGKVTYSLHPCRAELGVSPVRNGREKAPTRSLGFGQSSPFPGEGLYISP